MKNNEIGIGYTFRIWSGLKSHKGRFKLLEVAKNDPCNKELINGIFSEVGDGFCMFDGHKFKVLIGAKFQIV